MSDTATTGGITREKSSSRRPILATTDHPVDPDAFLLDADSFASDNDETIIEHGAQMPVADVEQTIRSLENAADVHDSRSVIARQRAQLLRNVLHETAARTERATSPSAGRM